MHSGPHSQLRRIYCPKGQAALARWSHSYWYPPLAPPFAPFGTPVLALNMNNFSHSWHPTAAHQPKLRRYRSASLLYEAEENNRMEQPKQRFPESSSEIYRPGSRLKIVLKERSGAREIE